MDESQGAEARPRVVDFSTHVPGPTASRWLAHLGADVIKVEHPRFGDGTRGGEVTYNGEGILHLYLNAGVRSVAVDPKSADWIPAVARLVEWADVVIVGNRPSRAAALGIDYESVLRLDADIVYCQITGYGLDGPWANLGGHGLNIDAMAGSLTATTEGGRTDPVAGYRTTGTNAAGMSAASGIFAALYRRERGLGSQYVHISVWEAAVSWAWRDALSHSVVKSAMPEYRDAGPRNAIYRTKDGGMVMVCPIERHFWEQFCDALNLPGPLRARGDWEVGTCDGTGPEGDQERQLIQERISRLSRDEVVELLSAADIPISPVLSIEEATSSGQAAVNGTMMRVAYRGEVLAIPAVPVSVTSRSSLSSLSVDQLSEAHKRRSDGLRPPPERIGQHTHEVHESVVGFAEPSTDN